MPITISGSTGIAGVDGSASTPAVQGTDTNTGIAFPAADTVAVATGGTERMRVDSSGNVGIGTTSPSTGIANRVLAINGTDAGIHFLVSGTDTSRIYTSSGELRLQTATAIPLVCYTNNTERMRINSSGNVGIGTSSPDRPLKIGGASASLGIDAGSGAIVIDPVNSGIAQIDVSGANALRFNTNNTERMRIDSSGNLLFNSGYGSVATAYGCRAWVHFNGQGVISIRASGNVSSITDNNIGEYSVNFTTPMVDANYSAVVAHSHWGGVTRLCDVNADGYSVNQFGMIIVGQQTTSWATFDPTNVCVSIFR